MPFLETITRQDLARELNTTEKKLTYLIYKVPDSKRYKSFEIPKRNGEKRQITAPNKYLKALQRKLADKLNEVYPGRAEVHGYSKGRNTYSGAKQHLHKRWIVNIDLEDFFPSIHFGRVKGMFQARPFSFDAQMSRELANICCCGQSLPQGAPTSPVISNLICWKLDNQLHAIAKEAHCIYTRYADDITFSTNQKELPSLIGEIDGDGQIHLSQKLLTIIDENRFRINVNKVRYACRNNRQEVTGLIVNGRVPNVRRTYVRQVRAMLNACEKYGVDAAAEEHFNKFCPGRNPDNKSVSFMREIVGKAGDIRYINREIKNESWSDSPVYKPIHKRIKALFPEAQMAPSRTFIAEADMPVLLGEGKTDWKILSHALSVLQVRDEYTDVKIKFREYAEIERVGSSILFDFCEKARSYGYQKKMLCLFDGDLKQSDYSRATAPGKNYRDWGGNVFSIVLPKPAFREKREISIEQYFTDEEIKTPDEQGRRLFLSDEFNPKDGSLLLDSTIAYKGNLGVFNKPYVFVIEDKVFDSNGRSLAMSKNDFAENVRAGKGAFGRFSYDNFRLLFDVIREVLNN